MTSRYNILLITKEDAIANTASSTFHLSQRVALAGIFKEISQISTYLSHSAIHAVVVDIDPEPHQILSDLSTMITTYPRMCVVVVSSNFSEELILKAMQAGARHFMRKSSIASELEQVLERLLADEAKKELVYGEAISVFSAGGGCGATTITLNLANELRLMSSEPVLTIDLDTCYGTVSNYLGITGKYGIADVLERKGLIDKHLIESSAYSYDENFYVLISPAGIKDSNSRLLQYENLTKVVEACKKAFRYTVIDAPRVAQSVATDLAAVSKFTLIVFQLTVKDVKCARSLISFLCERGIPPGRIIPLANRVKRQGPQIRLEDSKQAVGLDTCYAIRSDWRNAMKSLNSGQPLAQVARRSGLRRDFKKLASKIHYSVTQDKEALVR